MPIAIDAMKASLTLRPRSLDADLMPANGSSNAAKR